jgi:hypothetical protein
VILILKFVLPSRYGVTTQEAHKFVQSIRFCGNPNEGFMAQLREYEPIYRAMHVVPLPLPSAPSSSSSSSSSLIQHHHQRLSKKRSLEQDEGDEPKGSKW